MKKLVVLFVAMFGILTISGCAMDGTLDLPISEEIEDELIATQEWESATFKTLTGSEDLMIERDSQNKNALSILNPAYDQEYLAVVLLKSDCEKSKTMVPYLDNLAARINSFHNISYVPVMLDIYEDSTNTSIEWVNNLSNLEVFMNAATACSGNACQEVFLPKFTETLSGSIYFVHKNDITKTKKGFSWDENKDPEEQANTMEQAFVKFLDLDEIYMDPSVNPWN